MLPELLYGGITACAGSIGLGLGIYFTPWKRVAKIVGSYMPRARRMRSIDTDMAMHLSLEVDLEWWDKRYNALVEKTAPPFDMAIELSKWSRAIQDEIAKVERSAAEAEESNRRKALRSFSEGDVTYSFDHLTNAHATMVQMGVLHPGEAYMSAGPRGEDGPVHPSMTDARPPGLPSVREAQEAGVDIAVARKRIAEAFANHPGASSIPRDKSVALRGHLDDSQSWDRLVDAVRRANEAIDEYYDCPDCSQVDVRTWADSQSRFIKGQKCFACRARILRDKVAYWS